MTVPARSAAIRALAVVLASASPALSCVVGDGTDESCTEAAFNACLFGPGFDGIVTFACNGPETITLTAPKNITAATVIDGTGAIQLRAADGLDIILAPQAPFTIQNLTILGNGGGTGVLQPSFSASPLTVTNVTIASTLIGISSSGGTVTVTNSAFIGNTGVAIAASDVTVTRSTFAANGNGLTVGTASVTDSDFSGHTLGAINSGTSLTVAGSTFNGNSGGSGGAIVSHGTATVSNSTFFNNVASVHGGAIEQLGAGPLTVINSTFEGNSAPAGAGGAIGVSAAGPVTVVNSILANSISGGNCSGTIGDGGHNIDSGATCGFAGTGCATGTGTSFCNTAPLLGALTNNGGPTQTIALQAGSPAIDAGDQTVCAAPPVNGLDQRGFVRPGAGATSCSIGAYEFDATPATTTSTSTTTSTTSSTTSTTTSTSSSTSTTSSTTSTTTSTSSSTSTTSSTTSTTSTSSTSSSTSSSSTTSTSISTSTTSTTLAPCGNGEIDPDETCGEPSLECTAGEVCVACTCRQLGDCQEDGGVPNLFDVLEMIDVLLERHTPNANQLVLCNVDCNDRIDLFDMLKLIDLVLERLEPPLQCPE